MEKMGRILVLELIAAWARGFVIGFPFGFVIVYFFGGTIGGIALRLVGVPK